MAHPKAIKGLLSSTPKGGAKGQMAEWREDTGRNERWEPRERSSEMDNDDEERGRGVMIGIHPEAHG